MSLFRRHRGLVLVAAMPVLAVACREPRATQEQCGRILDRIVELEMEAMGFRDPVLRQMKQHDLRLILAPEVMHCTKLPMTDERMACVERAKTVDDMMHGCLSH